MSKPRVVFITRKYPPAIGGMETWSYELYQRLSKEANVTLLKPNLIETGRTPIKVIFKFFINTFIHLSLNLGKYDVVHITDASLYALCFIKWVRPFTKTRIIVSTHGLDVAYALQKGIKPKLYKLYQSLIPIAPINRWVGNSYFTNRILEKRFPGTLLPLNTIHLGTTLPSSPHIKTLSTPPSVIYAGRIIERKGLPWFIQQVLPLVNIRLHVVGPVKKEFAHLLEHPKIVYHGVFPQEELFKLLKDMHIGIFPNIPIKNDVEGYGLMALEYAAHGLLVLASDMEGLKESAAPPVGMLLAPKNAPVWIDTISSLSKLTQNQYEHKITEAYNHLHGNNTWDIVASKYLKLYNDFKN